MQRQDRLGAHSFLFFPRPRDVEPQAASTAIAGVDSEQLGTLMVAQSAAKSAGAVFDATGQPARYETFHFTVHMGAPADFSIPITLKSVERNVTTGCGEDADRCLEVSVCHTPGRLGKRMAHWGRNT
jgi:hypothetical protein